MQKALMILFFKMLINELIGKYEYIIEKWVNEKNKYQKMKYE